VNTEGYHVKVYLDSKKEWRWKTVASNGETVASSTEGYIRKDHALEQARVLNPQIEVRVEE
jgi:uncharacterized protein YegP (UPF0339 family)